VKIGVPVAGYWSVILTAVPAVVSFHCTTGAATDRGKTVFA
jgi:hypothetical protein